MPFALLLFSVLFITAGIRGEPYLDNLYGALKSDFTGDKNFIYWVVAVIFIVAVGNVKTLRPVSNAFLGLVILIIILQNGKRGLFQNFLDQVKAGTQGGSIGGGSILDITAKNAGSLGGKTQAEAGIHLFGG